MREIFTNKGYQEGSHYKRNGLEYGVVTAGGMTALSVTQGEVTNYYSEVNGNFTCTDETFSEFAENPITAEEALELHQTVSEIVNRDAVALNLPDPENVHDRVTTYLAAWKKHHEEDRGEVVTPAAVAAQFAIANGQTQRNLIELTLQVGMSICTSKDSNRPISNEQLECVFDWMNDEARKGQILTMDEVLEKYDQIQDLLEQHQLNAIFIGLTVEQATDISWDQSEYLRDLYERGYVDEHDNEMDYTPANMQAKFLEIESLTESHQINAFNLGLMLEQAEEISESQYDYLRAVYDNEDGGIEPERMQDRYEEISDLKLPHQINAYAMGLSLEQSEIISEYQFEYLNNFREANRAVTALELQEKYGSIQNLTQEHQIKAVNIGLTPAQAQNIPVHTTNYLFGIFNKGVEEQTPVAPTAMQQIFEQISNLQGHQQAAFNRGLDHQVAANISFGQYQQINNIKSQYLALPRGRESIKETDRRFFQYAYQNFLRVPIADVPSAAVAVNEAGRLRECEASTEEDKQSKKSRRDDGGRS